MYYTNQIKVTLKNEETAAAALEIMKARLIAGFDCDKNYHNIPSIQMAEDLDATANTIELPEDCGYYLPEDAEKVIPELMLYLAAKLRTEDFTFTSCSNSDPDEGWVDGSYANGELKVKTTYLPSGFGDLYCQECDEVIATMEDDADGNLFIEHNEGICPECDEENDLSDWLPIISKKTIKII